jgi:transcriptional regulator with XRE-family HTH domain
MEAMTDMTTGQRIRLARIRMGLTQEDLAGKAGVMRATVIRAENDQVQPQPMTLHKITTALGVDPQEVM